MGDIDMGYSDIYTNIELISKIQTIQEAAKIANSPAMQEFRSIVDGLGIRSIGELDNMVESIQSMAKQVSMLCGLGNIYLNRQFYENISKQFLQMSHVVSDAIEPISKLYSYEHLRVSVQRLNGVLGSYNLVHYYSDTMSDEDVSENEKINNKIVTEIFNPDEKSSKETEKKESAIITLSPVNEKVLGYLAENPEALYQLEDREFEFVMAEIYSKLGYKVELTKATRDGGKDIIIRKPEILGDFVYYVECKKYAAKRHIGVGIVRELVGTVLTDKVNGGILATTSYFSPDAKKFIKDNKYNYQIQMHDYDVIRNMLNKVV
jgi:HJR/Mrr/RecB family endonuclease